MKNYEEIIKKIFLKKEKLMNDPRATAAYWNADDWGSISGFKDAEKWVNTELGKYLKELLK